MVQYSISVNQPKKEVKGREGRRQLIKREGKTKGIERQRQGMGKAPGEKEGEGTRETKRGKER